MGCIRMSSLFEALEAEPARVMDLERSLIESVIYDSVTLAIQPEPYPNPNPNPHPTPDQVLAQGAAMRRGHATAGFITRERTRLEALLKN